MTDTRHGRAGPEVLRAAGVAAPPRKGPSTLADSRRIVRSEEPRGHAGAVRFRLPSPLPAETGSLRFRAGGFRAPARGGAGTSPCWRPTPVLPCPGFTRLGFSGRGCVQVLQRCPERKKLVPRLTRLSNPSARPCHTGRRTPRNLRPKGPGNPASRARTREAYVSPASYPRFSKYFLRRSPQFGIPAPGRTTCSRSRVCTPRPGEEPAGSQRLHQKAAGGVIDRSWLSPPARASSYPLFGLFPPPHPARPPFQ